MFQFPRFASSPYVFRTGYPRKGGFPHSDIRGSTIARISPRLFAACHVLHRLLAPRHPPNALVTLTLSHHRPRAGPNRASAPLGTSAQSSPNGAAAHHYFTHTFLQDAQPSTTRPPQRTPHAAARPNAPPDPDSPFERTCPFPGHRPERGISLREVSAACATPFRKSRPARNTHLADRAATHASRVAVHPPTGDFAFGEMEASGFEPLTPCLQSRCSTS